MKIKNPNFIACIFACVVFLGFASFKNPQSKIDKSAFNLSGFESGARVSRAQLMVYKYVAAGFGEDFAFDGLKLKVKSYTFVMVKKQGNSYIENVTGNQLTASIKQHLKTAKPGDIIMLSQVKIKGDGWDFDRTINGPGLTVY